MKQIKQITQIALIGLWLSLTYWAAMFYNGSYPWQDNIICGEITWKNQGIEQGKYQAHDDYKFVIDFEKGYGRRTKDVPASTYISYNVGDRICYDLPDPKTLGFLGFIAFLILLFNGITIALGIIYLLIKFFKWLLD